MDVEGEATNGQAFITMGTPGMLMKESMLRYICPGMSNRFHGSQKNNTHSVPYDVNLLVSPTHCFFIDTKASGQTKKLSNNKDGFYAGRMIRIGNERRIICLVYEQRIITKPNDQKKSFKEIVRYDIRIRDQLYQHHQFMLIYATACGIGKTSYEYIFSKLRNSLRRTWEGVKPDDRCDGDHCFHRQKLISNSIYFCFPLDHATNRCLLVHRKKARDWNYTLVDCGLKVHATSIMFPHLAKLNFYLSQRRWVDNRLHKF